MVPVPSWQPSGLTESGNCRACSTGFFHLIPGIKAIRWYLPQFTRKPGAHLHKLVELPGLAGYGHVLPPARQLRH